MLKKIIYITVRTEVNSSTTSEICPQLPERKKINEAGSVRWLRSSRRLQKGNLTELHCQRQQIITHIVQEGVSKEVCTSTVHSTFQQGRIRTVCSIMLYCVALYRTPTSSSHSSPTMLSSDELRNTFSITLLRNRRNVFITRWGFLNTLCTCIYNTQHLFPELKQHNMCS